MMASPIGLARSVLKAFYRRMPLQVRSGMSALIHGETSVQKDAISGIRAASSRIHVEGHGDHIAGGALRPYKAVTVTSFDAWKHLGAMRDAVVSALDAASIEVFELPNQKTSVLVVSSVDWDRVWECMATSSALVTFWAQGATGRPRPMPDYHTSPTHDALMLFQNLRSPNGDLVADERIHIRLERWHRLPNSTTTPRDDGGFHEEGTLLCSSMPNTFASYLSPNVQERLRAHPGQAINWYPSIDAVHEPVDIVYTWVDGSDPVWLAKRNEWEGGNGGTPDSQISARFENRDELKYSLRSVEMYAGWHNRIFLVTDDQVPQWLRKDNPRLTIVDHRELFDPSELPVFNSHAIESRLHRIEGLSELFIYMNDDVFFGRPVSPELFFTGAGHIKFFPSKAHIDPDESKDQDVSVTAAAKNNRRLLERAVGRTFSNKLKHTPHAQSRSLLQELEQRFPTVFEANVAAKFRTRDDHSVVSSLIQRYGQARGRAVAGTISYNYADISRPDLTPALGRWLRARSLDAFCLNETGIREIDAKERLSTVTAFLDEWFPLSSRYEMEQIAETHAGSFGGSHLTEGGS